MEIITEAFAQLMELLTSVLGEGVIDQIMGFFGKAVDFIMGLFG